MPPPNVRQHAIRDEHTAKTLTRVHPLHAVREADGAVVVEVHTD